MAHVNSRDLEAISSRLDTLQGTIRKLWWGIAIQTSIIILTLIIGAIVAGIVRAVVGGP